MELRPSPTQATTANRLLEMINALLSKESAILKPSPQSEPLKKARIMALYPINNVEGSRPKGAKPDKVNNTALRNGINPRKPSVGINLDLENIRTPSPNLTSSLEI